MGAGKVVHVVGPVVDVQFFGPDLPAIHNALRIQDEEHNLKITLEVEEHLGDGVVRCVAMSTTRGLSRGISVEDTGSPISIPVGESSLGRVVNLLGAPLDGEGPIESIRYDTIHKSPPPFDEQVPAVEFYETGIKSVDLLAPFPRGGKVGLFGGAGVGKTDTRHTSTAQNSLPSICFRSRSEVRGGWTIVM